jgi:hypothetical protein
MDGAAANKGRWLGTGPRITRSAPLGEDNVTHAVGIYAWPTQGPWNPRAPLAGLSDEIRRKVAEELSRGLLSGNWSAVTVAPYDPAKNGAVDWWNCREGTANCAQTTVTRDTWPSSVSVRPDENPVGPGTVATPISQVVTDTRTDVRTGIGQAGQNIANQAKQSIAPPWWFWPAIGLTVVGVGGAAYKYYTQKPRPNPRRRRRH